MRRKAADLLKGIVGLLTNSTAVNRAWPVPGRALDSRVEELTDEVARLRAQLKDVAAESLEMRSELSRLDEDLDESRRLNLRAAELLDIVFTELSSREPEQKRRAGGDEP